MGWVVNASSHGHVWPHLKAHAFIVPPHFPALFLHLLPYSRKLVVGAKIYTILANRSASAEIKIVKKWTTVEIDDIDRMYAHNNMNKYSCERDSSV